MSDRDGPAVPISGATLIWAIAVMFVAVLGAVCVLALALPESQNPLALVGQLLTAFAALVATIVTLFKVSRVERKVDGVETKVDAAAEDTKKTVRQTNGDLHRVIRDTAYESVTRALADRLDT